MGWYGKVEPMAGDGLRGLLIKETPTEHPCEDSEKKAVC